MLRSFFSLQYNNGRTVLILFLFLFHMLGLRLFPGIGFLIAFLIFVLLAQRVIINNNRFLVITFLALFASLFQLIKGSPLNYCILVALYVINAVLLVYYVQKRDARNDFKAALKIFVIQAFLSALVYLIMPKSLVLNIHWSDAMLQDRTILGLFFYTSHPRDMLPFLHIPRISGWAWEPGALQLLVNLYLCLEVFDRAKIKELLIPSIVLILTASTAGYIIWALVMLLYFRLSGAKRLISLIPVAAVVAILVGPMMVANITEKFSIGTESISGSGAIRMRDFFTGIEEIKQYPIFGINVSDLSNSKQYQQLEDVGLSHIGIDDSVWHGTYDYAAGGYCNGFFAMHMFWGVLGIVLLFSFLKCRLWRAWSYGRYWLIFPSIISLSLLSEPISNTSFFLFLCFYNFISNNKVDAYFNRNSNIQCRKDALQLPG